MRIVYIIQTAVLCAALGVSLWMNRRREKQIEELTMYLMKLQDEPEVPEPTGQKEGKLGVLQSEIYKLTAHLKQRTDRKTEEKRYLADMLSDISHQIKTPLAAITLMTDLLKDPRLSQEKRLEYVKNIDRQAERITWLIRNLLTLSQLEAGVLKLKQEKISAKELLRRAAAAFEILAEIKEIELDVQAEGNIMITCDIHWTAEALSNIIKNALEHTPAGGKVSVLASQSNLSTNIRIRDNGDGISKEKLAHVFERFYKADPHSKTSVGIGLSMSRQIVMLQNGVIHASSEEGKGTEFLIKLYSN